MAAVVALPAVDNRLVVLACSSCALCSDAVTVIMYCIPDLVVQACAVNF